MTQTEEQTEQKGAGIVAKSNQGEIFFSFFFRGCPVGGGLPKPKSLLGLPHNRPYYIRLKNTFQAWLYTDRMDQTNRNNQHKTKYTGN